MSGPNDQMGEKLSCKSDGEGSENGASRNAGIANSLSLDEARRKASNIAKLPTPLPRK
jgi:hypothetical protein